MPALFIYLILPRSALLANISKLANFAPKQFSDISNEPDFRKEKNTFHINRWQRDA